MKRITIVCIGFLALAVISAGCTKKEKESGKDQSAKKASYAKMSESDLWAAAQKDNDPVAYDVYLTDHPNAQHAKEAKKILMKEWDEKTKAMSPADMAKLTAVIETNRGTIKFKFYPEDAPNHCRNFIKLAQSHFYDGTIFHRVVKGFVIQGGDPLGTGMGGPGYQIKAEFNKRPHLEGTVAMARSQNPDSAGSQFYICLAPQPMLNNNYTVFGQVIEGLDVVHAIGDTKTGPNDRPVQEQVMTRVYIEGL